MMLRGSWTANTKAEYAQSCQRGERWARATRALTSEKGFLRPFSKINGEAAQFGGEVGVSLAALHGEGATTRDPLQPYPDCPLKTLLPDEGSHLFDLIYFPGRCPAAAGLA